MWEQTQKHDLEPMKRNANSAGKNIVTDIKLSYRLSGIEENVYFPL